MSNKENNNIVSFNKKVAERKKAIETKRQEREDLSFTELPEPNIEDIGAFMRVLGYLRQISPDQTGNVRFDEFSARVTLDANRIDWEEDIPQINVGLAIEGVLPFVWSGLTIADLDDPEEEASLEECVEVAHDILLQLDSDPDSGGQEPVDE